MKPEKKKRHEKGLTLINRVEADSLQLSEDEEGERCCSAPAASAGVERLPMLGRHTRVLQEDELQGFIARPS